MRTTLSRFLYIMYMPPLAMDMLMKRKKAECVTLDRAFLRQYFGLVSFKDLSVITAKGDSMSPTIPENSQLIVQKRQVSDGQICITRIDNELYVKRLQKLST